MEASTETPQSDGQRCTTHNGRRSRSVRREPASDLSMLRYIDVDLRPLWEGQRKAVKSKVQI
jgi:hypothetical protein